MIMGRLCSRQCHPKPLLRITFPNPIPDCWLHLAPSSFPPSIRLQQPLRLKL